MTKEEWREIPDYPDYQISNLGRVKSLWYGKERILKPSKDKYGHLLVNLYNESKQKTCYIHRLLGIIFLGFPEDAEIDHINGDPSDNNLENLRACTHQENLLNIGKKPKNTSGFPGVGFHKGVKKYQARIRINGKQKYLGLFKRPEEAFIAYRDASLEAHGAFSPFNCRDDFKALSAKAEATLAGAV